MGNDFIAKVKTNNYTQYLFFSHFPYLVWPDGNRGVLHVHGHEHGRLVSSQPEYLRAKRLDVGVDNFPYPAGFDQLMEIMSTKIHTTLDGHDANTSPSF